MVVNTHITCNFQHPDTQTAQGAIMMQEITRLRKEYTTLGVGDGGGGVGLGQQVPELILCGDFNSFPDSGMYRLITEGHLGVNHPHANAKEDLGMETILTPALLQHKLGKTDLRFIRDSHLPNHDLNHLTIKPYPNLINTIHLL